MKVPKARKQPSGSWFIQLRLGGESIPVTAATEKLCIREATAIKAEYLAGRRAPKDGTPSLTLTAAIDRYIESKNNALSPSTVGGYRVIQRGRFQSTMSRDVFKISPDEWQGIVNAEAAICGPKTLRNAYFLIKSVCRSVCGIELPSVTMPGLIPAQKEFLTPDQIKIFVREVKNTPYAVPALLALSSLRSSEIAALRWENIPEEPKFIPVSGAAVRDAQNHLVLKPQNKNATSARQVPVLIPELKEAIRRERKPSGAVLCFSQDRLRDGINKVCENNGFPRIGIHGLRHSFASLAYHLNMPEKIAMEIGGWADAGTMHRIYTHIARSDIERYQKAIGDFYEEENANENANGKA